jgi:hypothetical protein
MSDAWREYQSEATNFFRGLGLTADTDVALNGVRTSHDVDVVVRLDQLGFNVTWVVECKLWQTKVSKVHVLALRQIVVDVGADRGILLCEAGFQSGAVEASHLTNVVLTSLAEFQVTARDQVNSVRLRELFDHVEKCRERYWHISKSDRIDHGLRPDVGAGGYSGIHVIDYLSEVLAKAFRNVFPFECDSLLAVALDMERPFNSIEEALAVAEPMVSELEGRLDACERRKG